MASVEKVMDHSAYQRKVKKMSSSSLWRVIKDCKAALEAYPENPNAGYYQDEIHYCAMELNRRS